VKKMRRGPIFLTKQMRRRKDLWNKMRRKPDFGLNPDEWSVLLIYHVIHFPQITFQNLPFLINPLIN